MIVDIRFPRFKSAHRLWFETLIKSMVSKPDAASTGRRKESVDLEIAIRVAKEDERLFTPEVCEALQTLLAAMTRIPSPIVYIFGKPHHAAIQAVRSTLQP